MPVVLNDGVIVKKKWVTQLPVDYIDTTLVASTPETVVADLSGGKPARLWYIIVEQTNNGATAEDIELDITINGTAYTATLTGVASGSQEYVVVSYSLATGDFNFVNTNTIRTVGCVNDIRFAIPFIAKTVGLIRVQQTSTVDGTAAQIEVNIIWDKFEEAG